MVKKKGEIKATSFIDVPLEQSSLHLESTDHDKD